MTGVGGAGIRRPPFRLDRFVSVREEPDAFSPRPRAIQSSLEGFAAEDSEAWRL